MEDLETIHSKLEREVAKMIRTENLPKNVTFIGERDGFKYYISLTSALIYEVKA